MYVLFLNDFEVCEEVVEDLGGRVVRTEGLHQGDFVNLASDAETVVADHGAAMFNLLLWNTKNVVEIAAEDWWTSCFLALSKALGIESHTVLRPALHSPEELRALLQQACQPEKQPVLSQVAP